MVPAAELLWIVQLSLVLCLIRAQEQAMLGGYRNRGQYARLLNGEYEDDMDANADVNLEAEMGRRLRRSQGSDTQGRLMDGAPIAASNMDIPAADQNMINTCQVVKNPNQEAIAPPASASISESHQPAAQLWSSQQQPQSQDQQQLGTSSDRICDPLPNAYAEADETEQRRQDLRNLVQHLYVAQARVQLEATEIRKAQALASSAQAQLEESANQVRTVTASLHTAQQEVAASAIRAQIAQLQLAAHDQLLFAARQDVDALSSQMVGLQAAEGIVQPKLTVDLHALLDKLRQPLQQNDHPTPVPAIVASIPGMVSHQQQQMQMQQQHAQGQGQGQGQIPGQSRMPDNSRNGASDYMSRANSYSNLGYT